MAYNPDPSRPPMASPVAVEVVGPQFCDPYEFDLIMCKKLMNLAQGSFAVTDANGNLMFKVERSDFSLHNRRVLLDAAGNPIVSLRQKILTAHKRWEVYRGDSSDSIDLLFSAKKSSFIQSKTELDVFLAANTEEDVCDFKIKGSWFERSCTIFLRNTSTIIAQMRKKHSAQSILNDKDTFSVTVYPHVDYAFIVALVVILNEIIKDRKDND